MDRKTLLIDSEDGLQRITAKLDKGTFVLILKELPNSTARRIHAAAHEFAVKQKVGKITDLFEKELDKLLVDIVVLDPETQEERTPVCRVDGKPVAICPDTPDWKALIPHMARQAAINRLFRTAQAEDDPGN